MNAADVRDLFDYNSWANARVLDAAARVAADLFVDPAPVTTRNLRGTLVHQLDVEWSWRRRWQGLDEAELLRDEDFPTVAALGVRWREDEREMRAFLAGLGHGDPNRPVDLGGPHPPPLWLLMLHVVNHGTQQRADAAVLLTRYGSSPGGLDVADFARARAANAGDRVAPTARDVRPGSADTPERRSFGARAARQSRTRGRPAWPAPRPVSPRTSSPPRSLAAWERSPVRPGWRKAGCRDARHRRR